MKSIKRAYFKCPIGYVEVTGTEHGVQTVTISDQKMKKWFVPLCLREAVSQLKEYFKGDRQLFTARVDVMGTDFQMRVWDEVGKIPYGKTITYHQLAERIGDPKAFRAVGQADSKNPVWIIIPCHRVIGNDGKLVGYAGGLWRKKWLLEHEQAFAQKDLFY
ncbi:MAG: methylated-DNA--[protein]-cysteine S-methyltransferase [Bacteroidales bacterium]|nr:methylated-DNA--[protein]-cysteine S-methyltransferase [Bacteroidales bacterium]